MPRPGPRPYECVRRAWHSDRHQPMRGSIIQQIFRVVNDSHSLATKKNREWQEKLPMVVIRAEEIMYSKANSEAEYMNLETLWERVNDAINTIIRREESTETGDLLPPCVEAALNLGCVPVRASRSQRHNNPRTYLTPRVQEPVPETSRISDRLTSEQFLHSPAVHSPHAPKVARSENACSVLPVTESSNPVIERHERAAPSSHPLQYENGSQRFNQLMALETKPSMNLGSVYPLYYGNHHHTEELQEGSRVPKNPGAILVGTPVGPSVPEHTETIMWPNFLSRKSSDGSSNTTRRDDGRSTAEKSQEKDCDLSLRLSLSSDPCGSMRRTQVPYAEDFDSRCLQGDTVFTASHQHVDKKFCFLQSTTLNTEQLQFLPSRTSNMEQLQFTPYNWISGDKDRILEASLRKRKEPFRNNEGAGQSGWLPEYRHNWDTGL